MRLIRALCFSFVLCALNLFARDPDILTLPDAIQLALQHNRAVKSAQLEVKKSSDRVSAARTHLFPAISFSVFA
jgi:outer membrane protein TolC